MASEPEYVLRQVMPVIAESLIVWVGKQVAQEYNKISTSGRLPPPLKMGLMSTGFQTSGNFNSRDIFLKFLRNDDAKTCFNLMKTC